ncbi:MAG: hypothetical protein NC218_02125 [Acetobacter sp.]|nr:hypothetical protein [Acetobacter sp.]
MKDKTQVLTKIVRLYSALHDELVDIFRYTREDNCKVKQSSKVNVANIFNSFCRNIDVYREVVGTSAHEELLQVIIDLEQLTGDVNDVRARFSNSLTVIHQEYLDRKQELLDIIKRL